MLRCHDAYERVQSFVSFFGEAELRRFYLKRHAAAADLTGIDPDEALDMSEVTPLPLPAPPVRLPRPTR